MPTKQKQKKTTNLQNHAIRMINLSALLTEESKNKWLSRIPKLTELQCKALIENLYREFSFLSDGLKTTLRQLLETGNKKNLRLFDQLLRTTKTKLRGLLKS